MALPTPSQAYDLLRNTGDMLPSNPACSALDGVYFNHPGKPGRQVAHIDDRVLPVLRKMYTGNSVLRQALEAKGVVVGSMGDVTTLIKRCSGKGVIWGFSGYATAGKEYRLEADAMRNIYESISKAQMPSLVVDGGVSAGVLGLSSALAAEFGVQTLGVIPVGGLDSIGPRNDMLVWGDTYQQREKMVAAIPDILWCVAGAGGTLRECVAAVEQGSVVVIVAPRNYDKESLPGSYKTHTRLRKAIKDGQLFACHPKDNIADCVKKVLDAQAALDKDVRVRRLEAARKLLTSKP